MAFIYNQYFPFMVLKRWPVSHGDFIWCDDHRLDIDTLTYWSCFPNLCSQASAFLWWSMVKYHWYLKRKNHSIVFKIKIKLIDLVLISKLKNNFFYKKTSKQCHFLVSIFIKMRFTLPLHGTIWLKSDLYLLYGIDNLITPHYWLSSSELCICLLHHDFY